MKRLTWCVYQTLLSDCGACFRKWMIVPIQISRSLTLLKTTSVDRSMLKDLLLLAVFYLGTIKFARFHKLFTACQCIEISPHKTLQRLTSHMNHFSEQIKPHPSPYYLRLYKHDTLVSWRCQSSLIFLGCWRWIDNEDDRAADVHITRTKHSWRFYQWQWQWWWWWRRWCYWQWWWW